jgi:uncharacterized protein YecE (DUF72 family)
VAADAPSDAAPAARLPTGAAIHIGTSGWSYAHWRGTFYAADQPASGMLAAYTQRFATVEINTSFYRLPAPDTVRHWRGETPSDFCFAAKASRYLTHLKKLSEPEDPLARFLGRLEILGEKLGPVLFQLPPHWACDLERLAAFLRILPAQHRYAFELRDPSWHQPAVYRLLREHHAAFCIYELAGFQSPLEVTTDIIYIRLHGPEGRYAGCYDHDALDGWAARLCGWRGQVRAIYCYFDNDEAGYAPRNALELSARIPAACVTRDGSGHAN